MTTTMLRHEHINDWSPFVFPNRITKSLFHLKPLFSKSNLSRRLSHAHKAYFFYWALNKEENGYFMKLSTLVASWKGYFMERNMKTFTIATSLLTVWKALPKPKHLILIMRQGRGGRRRRGGALPSIKYTLSMFFLQSSNTLPFST